MANEDDLTEYVCREWVDEVFVNISESEPYPSELLNKFTEMGVVVHMKLAKSQKPSWKEAVRREAWNLHRSHYQY